MTILANIAEELTKLDKKIEKELPTLETKAFFWFRNLDTGELAPFQKKIVKEWEPRIPKKLDPLTQEQYKKLRDWLGMSGKGIKEDVPVTKVNKVKSAYDYRVVLDLRDDVLSKDDE